MQTTLPGRMGASSRRSGSAHRSPVNSTGPSIGYSVSTATVAASTGAPAGASTAPTATVPAGVTKRAMRTSRQPTRGVPGRPLVAVVPRVATMVRMTPQSPTRGPLIMLGALAALLVLAGVLPWLTGGSGAARGFATPLLLVGLFAWYAALRAVRAEPAAPPRPATGRDAGPAGGCGGCRCGAGGCQGAAPSAAQ